MTGRPVIEKEVAELTAEKVCREVVRRRESTPEYVRKFYDDPYGFVKWAYRWGLPGHLEKFDGPDAWQKEFLIDLGEQVKQRQFDGRNPVAPIRMTLSTGHGIGKSSLMAWINAWILTTRPYCQGTVTANTFSQLETKTWAAMQHWFRMCRGSDRFVISANGIQHREWRKNWMCSPQTCREENSEAFAGQHAATSSSYYLIDESSALPETIWEVIEGSLTDGEPMVFAAGNPTRSTGKFFRINFGSERNRWNSRVIDSRDCMMPNKTQIAEWVQDYGEDSDFVRVRVKGLPPQASDMQYIDSGRVMEAQTRPVEVLSDEPLIAGVDLARGGGDKAVVRFRRGDDARSIPPIKIPSDQTRDSMLLVAKLADLAAQTHGGRKVAIWFVDGGGVGGPIIDRLVQLGHKNFVEIQFGGAAPDPRHFANQRAWMWAKMRDALGMRLAIDKDRELETDLTSVGLGRPDKTDRIVLESKEDMKKRGLASPDDADALCFVENTMVETTRGPVPIQEITGTDCVITPFGPSLVARMQVSETTSLTSVNFSNGSSLRGKGSHELFTFSSGVRRLDALTLTDDVDTFSSWRYALWRLVSVCFIGARSFGFKQAAFTFSPDARMRRRDFCIAGFTRTISDLYQRVSRFITRTITGAMMIHRTMNLDPLVATNATTWRSGSQIQWPEPRTTNIWPWLGQQRLSGTDLQKVSHGTANTAREYGTEGRQSRRSAQGAARSTTHSFLPEQCSAQAPADSRLRSGRTLRIVGYVLSAAKSLWLTVIGRRPVVPVSVQTESVRPTLVYNLTLYKHNAYYANGILVFNCLTFARPVAIQSLPVKPPEPYRRQERTGNGWMAS